MYWGMRMLEHVLPDNNNQTTPTLRYYVQECDIPLFDTVRKYPIWKEEHRAELESKIIDHYLMRQIGFETFGRFKHELNTRMREIMPYYVQMFKTTMFDYNPIENYSMTEGSEETAKGKGASSSKGEERFSDTPMNEVKNLDEHVTTATRNNAEAETESNTESKREAWRRGNIGVTSTQQLIQQERDIILNIDKLIIDELEDLFLGVF